MILSSDKDFAQLQKFPNVEQFSPILKKIIKEPFKMINNKQMRNDEKQKDYLEM